MSAPVPAPEPAAAAPAWSVERIDADRPERLDGLLDLFADAFEDPARYASRRPGAAWRRALLARDDFVALAVLGQGRVVGGLAAYVLTKFEQERREVYLYDLAVAASYRRRGIATALIRALGSIARTLGADVVYVQADLDDEPAIALYTKLGAREDVLHFDLHPPP
jgi:aminoglycoside 3-N-acetyltransferase I